MRAPYCQTGKKVTKGLKKRKEKKKHDFAPSCKSQYDVVGYQQNTTTARKSGLDGRIQYKLGCGHLIQLFW
jgi:hypothetical protein